MFSGVNLTGFDTIQTIMEPVENESSDLKEVISSSILRDKIAPLENAVLRMEKIMADTQSRLRKLISSSPESPALSQDISSSSNSKVDPEKDDDPDNDTEIIEQIFSDEKSTTLPEIRNGILTPCDSSTSTDETILLNDGVASSTCNDELNHEKESKDLTMPRITAQVDSGHSFEATEVCSSTTEELVVTSSNLKIQSQSDGDAMDGPEPISFSDDSTIIFESSDDERGISDETESGSSDNIAIKLYDVDDESHSYNDVGEKKVTNMNETNNESDGHFGSSEVVVHITEYNSRINRTLLTEINNVPFVPEIQKVINKDEIIDDKIAGEESLEVEVAPIRFATGVVETSVIPQEAIECEDENETNSSGANNCNEEVEIVKYFEEDTCCVNGGGDQGYEEFMEAEEGTTEYDDGKVESSVMSYIQENEVKSKTITDLVSAGHDDEALEGSTDVKYETNETAIQETIVEDTYLDETSGILENLGHNTMKSDIADIKFTEVSKDEGSGSELPEEKEFYARNFSDEETETQSETITNWKPAGNVMTPEGLTVKSSETCETAIQKSKVQDSILNETSGILEGCNVLMKSDIVHDDQFIEISEEGEGNIELNEEKVKSCAVNHKGEVETKFDTSNGGMADITIAVLTSNDNETPEGLTDVTSETSVNAIQKTVVKNDNLDETSGTVDGLCNDIMNSDIVGNDHFMEVSEEKEGISELMKEEVLSSSVINIIEEEDLEEKLETNDIMADITVMVSAGNDGETQESIIVKKYETQEIAAQKGEVKDTNLDVTSGVLDDSHNLLEGDVANEDVSNDTLENEIVSKDRNKVYILSEKQDINFIPVPDSKESVESLESAVTAGNYDEVCKILNSGTLGSLNALIEAVKGSYVEIFDCLFQAEIIKTVAEARKVLSVSKNACVTSTILDVWPNAVKGKETASLLLSVANNEEVLDVLLNAGGKVFLEEALCKILRKGDVDTFSKLVSKMTNVNCVVCCGQTLLHLAAEYNNVECISLLLQHGADIECTDRNGYTAIQRAVAFGSEEAVNILCEAGAISDPLDKMIETKSFYCCPNYTRIYCK